MMVCNTTKMNFNTPTATYTHARPHTHTRIIIQPHKHTTRSQNTHNHSQHTHSTHIHIQTILILFIINIGDASSRHVPPLIIYNHNHAHIRHAHTPNNPIISYNIFYYILNRITLSLTHLLTRLAHGGPRRMRPLNGLLQQ